MALDTFIRLMILLAIVIFTTAVEMILGSYVGTLIPFTKGDGFNWWAVISWSTGSLAGAAIAAPFLMMLFKKRRWLAALFAASPILLFTHSKIYMETMFGFLLHFSLLMFGMWLSARIFKTSSNVQSLNNL